jgi:hypothetical protein
MIINCFLEEDKRFYYLAIDNFLFINDKNSNEEVLKYEFNDK